MGMSYLTSVNPQLFKNIAYVGSFEHFSVQLFLHVFCNSTKTSANSSDRERERKADCPNGSQMLQVFMQPGSNGWQVLQVQRGMRDTGTRHVCGGPMAHHPVRFRSSAGRPPGDRAGWRRPSKAGKH